MKIIDLLNKIANGKVPSKIKYDDMIFEYDGGYYSSKNNIILEEYCNLTTSLNDEVEIIEEEKKITPNDFENLGYALGSIKKYINKGYDKAIEENKIPEKLKIEQDTPTSNYYIRNENGTKCSLTKHSKMIAETLNQLLDYLKSKGDE